MALLSNGKQKVLDVRDLKLAKPRIWREYSRRGRTPILAEPATVAFTAGHAMLTFRKGR